MKYHYFHGRFTYSVKRSGRGAEGCRALAGFRWLGRLSAFILVLKGERSSGVVGFRGGGFLGVRSGLLREVSAVFRGLRLAGPRPPAK